MLADVIIFVGTLNESTDMESLFEARSFATGTRNHDQIEVR